MIETQLLSFPNPGSDRSGATVLSQRVPALEESERKCPLIRGRF